MYGFTIPETFVHRLWSEVTMRQRLVARLLSKKQEAIVLTATRIDEYLETMKAIAMSPRVSRRDNRCYPSACQAKGDPVRAVHSSCMACWSDE